MAWFPKIDEKEDFQYLKRFVDNWVVKCKGNIAAYVEYTDMFARLQKAFEEAVQAEEIEVTKAVEKPTRKPREAKVQPLNLCPGHPTYKALRSPRTDCKGCWAAFEKYAGKPRAKQARTKFERKASG